MKENFELYNGVKIPKIGFGTWQIPDGDVVTNSVLHAVECGYTHIDTASAYYNETGVGVAIKKCGIARDELFITTKLWNTEQGYSETHKSFEQSIDKLGLEYLDLFLMHWPKTYVFQDEYPNRMKDTWRAFEELYEAKKIRAIGVSNFLPHHIDTLMEEAKILPMVNQIELHPGYNQSETAEYCKQKDILIECWSPLACGAMFKGDSPLNAMAKKYGKSIAQVALRWIIEMGYLPLPKSTHDERIKENINIFDFEMEKADVDFITNLPESNFSGYHPNHIEFLKEFG